MTTVSPEQDVFGITVTDEVVQLTTDYKQGLAGPATGDYLEDGGAASASKSWSSLKVSGLIGDLATLSTTDKSDLVAALNEVNAAVASSSGIDDGITSSAATWSSTKISQVTGLLPTLQTTDKSSLVAAINEVKNSSGSGLAIDDGAPATGAVWSSSKTDTQIKALVADGATATATTWSSSKIAGETGSLASLQTTDKSNLVAAINEVKNSSGSGLAINDGAPSTGAVWSSSKTNTEIAALLIDASTSATTAWSSSKISTEISAAAGSVVGGASTPYNSLAKIEALIQSNDTDIAANAAAAAANTAAVAQRVSTQAAQGLSGAEQGNARTNIDVYSTTEIGNPETNFVSTFQSGLA